MADCNLTAGLERPITDTAISLWVFTYSRKAPTEIFTAALWVKLVYPP